MRRVNIQAAFLGEGGESDTGDEEGLALAVRGGEVVLVLPAGTTENRAVARAPEPVAVVGSVDPQIGEEREGGRQVGVMKRVRDLPQPELVQVAPVCIREERPARAETGPEGGLDLVAMGLPQMRRRPEIQV